MAIAHIILLKIKPSLSETQAHDVLKAVAALREQLPAGLVESVHLGTNFSERSQGYTHAFTMIFKTKEDLNAYSVSEEHQYVVKNVIRPNTDGLLCVDYEVADYSFPRL